MWYSGAPLISWEWHLLTRSQIWMDLTISWGKSLLMCRLVFFPSGFFFLDAFWSCNSAIMANALPCLGGIGSERSGKRGANPAGLRLSVLAHFLCLCCSSSPVGAPEEKESDAKESWRWLPCLVFVSTPCCGMDGGGGDTAFSDAFLESRLCSSCTCFWILACRYFLDKHFNWRRPSARGYSLWHLSCHHPTFWSYIYRYHTKIK